MRKYAIYVASAAAGALVTFIAMKVIDPAPRPRPAVDPSGFDAARFIADARAPALVAMPLPPDRYPYPSIRSPLRLIDRDRQGLAQLPPARLPAVGIRILRAEEFVPTRPPEPVPSARGFSGQVVPGIEASPDHKDGGKPAPAPDAEALERLRRQLIKIETQHLTQPPR